MDRGEDKENSNISNTPDRLVQLTGEHHTKNSRLILHVDKQFWPRPLILLVDILLATPCGKAGARTQSEQRHTASIKAVTKRLGHGWRESTESLTISNHFHRGVCWRHQGCAGPMA